MIKVKYGETLRRFNARVNEVGQLDLDVGGLRGKVIGLFNFAPDADVTLTYIDEDGDVVTLVDEEDLCDVMRQSLNPLRITVELKAERGGRFHARSSGNSTPMRSSPRVQYPLPNLNSRVSEYLMSNPEPLREVLSKMAASPLFLTELVYCFSKMGQSLINPVSEFQAGTESSSQSVASGSAMGASMTNKETAASRDDGLTSYVFPNATVEEPASKADQKEYSVNSTRGSGSLNLNADLPSDSALSEYVSEILAPPAPHNGVGDNEGWFTKVVDCHTSEKAVSPERVDPKTLFPSVPASGNTEDVKELGEGWNSVSNVAFPNIAGSMGHSAGTAANLGGCVDARVPRMNLVNRYPFPTAYDSAVLSILNDSRAHPFKRSNTHSDGMGGVFHRGVQCDGCGVHPIAGPRFKSKVKEDFDLCSVCFSKMGIETEYMRIDRPAPSRRPHSFKGLGDPQQPWVRSSTLPDSMRGFEMNPKQLKLDSRFIMDVNVIDGTLMAPSTHFTKIWRLRNSGTIAWPQGTKLVWIGGDKLSASLSIDLEISADGIPLENELDVAADFTAPELPGRYISYWRMASPSGQKFGQRVWVLIQVDASLKDSYNSFQGLNLNLPPQDSGIADHESVNGNVEPMMVQSLVDAHPFKNQELDFPTNDTLLVGDGCGGSGVSITVRPGARTSISFPITQIASAVPSGTHVSSPSTIVPETVRGTGENNDIEQSLLKELEEMGFKHVDLNKEILRLNGYNLEQSLEDLCGISEWDPILEELQEMGFCDKEMNKKLLQKNKGSIKRVVLDLINGEKP